MQKRSRKPARPLFQAFTLRRVVDFLPGQFAVVFDAPCRRDNLRPHHLNVPLSPGFSLVSGGNETARMPIHNHPVEKMTRRSLIALFRKMSCAGLMSFEIKICDVWIVE